MKRISLILAGALACLLIASAGTAAAESEIPALNQTCKATSKNVIGHRITATVTGKDVASSQKRFANCGYVRKVIKGLTSIRIEKPKIVEGFRCTPSVIGTEPDVVRYGCLFQGADTATQITIRFTARYDLD
jgi:hypothetical protein